MVKKLLSVLIAVSIPLSSAVLPAAAEGTEVDVVTEFPTNNLIVNGGFEDDFEGWVTDDSDVFEIVDTSFTNLSGKAFNVVNGTKALKANVTNTVTEGYIYKEVDVNTNTNYVLNLSWFHLSTTKGNVRIYGDSMESENLIASATNLFGGEVWYSSTTAFNSGEYEKVIIKIEIFNPNPSQYPALYFCVDNFTLKAAGNTQTIDFENGYAEGLNVRGTAYEVTDEKAYEGNYSIKLTSGNGYQIANAPFALIPNRHYAVMFWYYIESGSLGAASKFAHENGWSAYTTSAHRTQNLSGTGEWKRAIMTSNDSVTGTGNNSFVELAFQNLATNTVVYIDNIECKYYDESVDKITITGNNESDGVFHAEVEAYNYGYNFEDPVSYQWQRSADKVEWMDIPGATEADYRLTRSDSLKFVRLRVDTTNRYGTAVSDSYYSKAIEVTDIGYRHKKGTSYGVEINNDTYYVDDFGAQSDFECVNKTENDLDLSVFIATYSDSGQMLDYSVEECEAVAAGESATVSKSFTGEGIGSMQIIVFDSNMNVYYAEGIEGFGADETEDKITFDKENQTITITGANNNKPEIVIVKDAEENIKYITVADCENKPGYKVNVTIDSDAYGKYTVFTSFVPNGKEIFYYSQEDYERVIGYFENEMDEEETAEVYKVLGIDNSLLSEIDMQKLTSLVSLNRAEVTGETLEEKKESAKAFLERMLVLQGYNQELSSLSDSDGKIIYEDILDLKGIDNEDTTYYNLYTKFLNEEGLSKLNGMLSGKDFENLEDFREEFRKSVILCAIAYPAVNGGGYISKILTDANMDGAGVEHSAYSSRTSSQRSKINEGLVKKVFSDISDLETEINKKPAQSSGNSSGGGGGGGGGSSSSKTPISMQIINTTTAKPQEDEPIADTQVMTFNDIDDSHWAYKYVYALTETGVINGIDENRFAPEGLVTREQFVKMLCDAFELSEKADGEKASFTDCVDGEWYDRYIKIAVSQGIIGGIGEGLFGIGRPVTREDLCVMAVRALGDVAMDNDTEFTDSNEISDYAKSAVSTLSAMKVISGYDDGSVRAKESCTRAQAAKIIYELREIKEIQQ